MPVTGGSAPCARHVRYGADSPQGLPPSTIFRKTTTMFSTATASSRRGLLSAGALWAALLAAGCATAPAPAPADLSAPLHAEASPEAGRRKLDGRIISIEGESGAETITFDFFEVFIARTPTAAVTALRGRRKKTAEVPPVRVTFPLSDVDNAHLLAELNFKG